jgi:glycosyltransferase involved in cell wall biosynthesis
MKKKVLYLSYDGLTDPLGQSQILPYLKYLSLHGFDFTILSFEKKSRLEKEGPIVQAIVDEAGIQWVPLSFTAKPPVLSKIYDRQRMWQIAVRLHKEKAFDLIHCRSYVAAEVGLKLKRKYGPGMLFDMRGFWADEKVDNGQWNKKHPLFRRIYDHYKKKEKDFLQHADGIISLTEAGKQYLNRQPAFSNVSIDVIPCCADLDHFNYEKVVQKDVQQLRQNLHLCDNDKVITYLGSVGGWYMIKEMFLFFKILLQTQPGYKMLILTKDDSEVVYQEAKEAGIDKEKIRVTYSDRKGLPLFLALSSCSIFFIRNTFSKMASSPTKHAELMGMGIPVICNDIGDTGNIIKATGTGLILNEFDEASIKAAIAKLPQTEAIDKMHIRKSAKNYFDLKNGAQKYLQVYTSILGLKGE